MNKLILIFLFPLIVNISNYRTVTVVDENGQTIAGAMIIDENGIKKYTDLNGNFITTSDTVKIEMISYEDYTYPINDTIVLKSVQ